MHRRSTGFGAPSSSPIEHNHGCHLPAVRPTLLPVDGEQRASSNGQLPTTSTVPPSRSNGRRHPTTDPAGISPSRPRAVPSSPATAAVRNPSQPFAQSTTPRNQQLTTHHHAHKKPISSPSSTICISSVPIFNDPASTGEQPICNQRASDV
ncbi:hypothetical protein ACLOJK_034342 [Asimina triloba]